MAHEFQEFKINDHRDLGCGIHIQTPESFRYCSLQYSSNQGFYVSTVGGWLKEENVERMIVELTMANEAMQHFNTLFEK